MSPLHENPSRCFITSAVKLAGLFEGEGEWEASEKARNLLYYYLKGNVLAALSLFDSLADRVDFTPTGSRHHIALQLGKVGSMLSRSINGYEPETAGAPSTSKTHRASAATAFS